MKYGSVCSGVEAASLAWESLGWQPAWFAEIECGNAELTDAQAVLIADMVCGIDKAEREKIERRRLTAFLGIGGYD